MPRIDQRLGFTRYEADEYYKQALDAYRKGDFDNAVDAMNNAIAALPKKAEYYAARGLMYLDDAVNQKALDDFDTALKLFPHELLAHYGRGVLAYREQNWDEALEHFTAAYYADTERPETLYYLALTYYRRRDFASAANLMKLAHDRFEALNDKRKTDAGEVAARTRQNGGEDGGTARRTQRARARQRRETRTNA